MTIPTHISHYFEKDAGPLLNICDLTAEQRSEIIQREKDADTGFNRYAHGEEFFEFRLLADDLLLEVYEEKLGTPAPRRPFFSVLGDADVVGGLYRDPYKIHIPIEAFAPHEITFMYPDHFHLVSYMKRGAHLKPFGIQIPNDYTPSKYPFYGKLLTYDELVENFQSLEIDKQLERESNNLGWYRYVEAQIWADPKVLLEKYNHYQEVDPEPWSYNGVTYLQNSKQRQKIEHP